MKNFRTIFSILLFCLSMASLHAMEGAGSADGKQSDKKRAHILYCLGMTEIQNCLKDPKVSSEKSSDKPNAPVMGLEHLFEAAELGSTKASQVFCSFLPKEKQNKDLLEGHVLLACLLEEYVHDHRDTLNARQQEQISQKIDAHCTAVKQKGDPEDIFELSSFFLNKKKFPKALELLHQAANKDVPLAEASLGNVYDHGLYGTQQNTKTALDWYRRAANHGDAPAQFRAAILLHDSDEQEARRMLEKSATNGFIQAQLFLSCLYEFGETKDKEKAKYWRSKAREQKNESEQNKQMYKDFFFRFAADNISDTTKHGANKMLLEAAENGHPEAQAQVAQNYAQGKHGIKQNAERATQWLARYLRTKEGTDKECIICFEPLCAETKPATRKGKERSTQKLLVACPNNHIFHKGCIEEWDGECPMCRAPFEQPHKPDASGAGSASGAQQ